MIKVKTCCTCCNGNINFNQLGGNNVLHKTLLWNKSVIKTCVPHSLVFTFIALKKIEQPPVKKNKNWYQCSIHIEKYMYYIKIIANPNAFHWISRTNINFFGYYLKLNAMFRWFISWPELRCYGLRIILDEVIWNTWKMKR